MRVTHRRHHLRDRVGLQIDDREQRRRGDAGRDVQRDDRCNRELQPFGREEHARDVAGGHVRCDRRVRQQRARRKVDRVVVAEVERAARRTDARRHPHVVRYDALREMGVVRLLVAVRRGRSVSQRQCGRRGARVFATGGDGRYCGGGDEQAKRRIFSHIPVTGERSSCRTFVLPYRADFLLPCAESA